MEVIMPIRWQARALSDEVRRLDSIHFHTGFIQECTFILLNNLVVDGHRAVFSAMIKDVDTSLTPNIHCNWPKKKKKKIFQGLIALFIILKAICVLPRNSKKNKLSSSMGNRVEKQIVDPVTHIFQLAFFVLQIYLPLFLALCGVPGN